MADAKKAGASSGTLPGWKDLPEGGIIDGGGTAAQYHTGDWRTLRPIWDDQKCIHCLLCWVFCPDSAIIVEDAKVKGVDYDHCKGCGICARECPPKVQAFTMESEAKFRA
jgi:pyruvate ferredoxin oxidoreductase delta subunit